MENHPKQYYRVYTKSQFSWFGVRSQIQWDSILARRKKPSELIVTKLTIQQYKIHVLVELVSLF